MATHYFKHGACKEKTRANEVYGFEDTPYIRHFVNEVAAADAHWRPTVSMGVPRYDISAQREYATVDADNGGSV